MIKKYQCMLVILLGLLYCGIGQGSINIRKAQAADMPGLRELDQDVTNEYFKPLYRAAYPHLPIGKNADRFLDQEIDQELQWISECIASESDSSVYVALDNENNRIVGVVLSHKIDETTLLLDLLLVRKECRKRGVGKALIHASIKAFDDVRACIAYTDSCEENNATLRFYTLLGFKNIGPVNLEHIYGIEYKNLHSCFRLDLQE